MVDKPKIIEHVVKSLDYTLFDARWIPCSARFVVLGNYARGTGAFQIYEVSKGDVKLLKSVSVCCYTKEPVCHDQRSWYSLFIVSDTCLSAFILIFSGAQWNYLRHEQSSQLCTQFEQLEKLEIEA